MTSSVAQHRAHRMIEGAIAVLTALLLAGLFFVFWRADLMFDEVMHYPRILGIAEGRLQEVQWGAMLPGYHFLIGGILRLTGVHSIAFARMVSFLVSAGLTLWAAWLVARSIDRESAVLRTLQVAVFPLLLAVLPILYTDALSLGLVLIALWAAVQKQSYRSALLLTLAILVRQNNVLWVPLLLGIVLEWNHGKRIALRSWKTLRSTLPFIIPCLVFLFFVLINHGLTVNYSMLHPFGFFPGNIYFALALFAGIFLPFIIGNLGRITKFVRAHRSVLVLLLLFLLLFLSTFIVNHPFNQDPQYWRNWALLAVAHEWLPWAVFALAMVLALLTMIVTRLAVPGAWLLYPMSALYLGASWLIDARYALIPLVLFLLLREKRSWKEEMVQYVWQVAVCMWIFA